jgi:hypothetical protein
LMTLQAGGLLCEGGVETVGEPVLVVLIITQKF